MDGSTKQQAEGLPLSAADWQRWHAGLDRLWHDSRLGDGPAKAFAWLWLRCRARVAEDHRFSVFELAAKYRKSPRTAEQWIERLQAAGIVVIKARGPSGLWKVNVLNPCPELAGEEKPDPPPDPQLRLPFMAEQPGCPDSPACPGEVGAKTHVGVCAKTHVEVCAKPHVEVDGVIPAEISRKVRGGQMSMSEAFTTIAGVKRPPPRPPPKPIRHAVCKDLDRDRNQNLDLGIESQKAVEAAIFQRLGDHDLQMSPVAKVAAQVVADRKLGPKFPDGYENRQALAWRDVCRAIDLARQRFREGRAAAPWKYFVGAMRRAFRERGLRWSGGPRVKLNAEG